MSGPETPNFHIICGFEILLSWEERIWIFLSSWYWRKCLWFSYSSDELFWALLVSHCPAQSGRSRCLAARGRGRCRSLQAGRAVSARGSGRGKCCSKIPTPAGEPLLVTASHVIASGINDLERMEHVIYKLSAEDKEALANARKSKWDDNQDVPGN